MDHPDLPPLGKLKDTILISSVSNPETNFSYYIKTDDKDFLFDIEEINNILDGLPINDPEVIKFLTKYLDENLEFI
jgi:hypothetical protein